MSGFDPSPLSLPFFSPLTLCKTEAVSGQPAANINHPPSVFFFFSVVQCDHTRFCEIFSTY